MAIYTALPDDLNEVDVIIAGGGTTGCVVAARLAEADPALSILVIEGGANNDIPLVSVPALFLANLMPTSTTNILYKTNKEKQLGDRELIVPSGGVLGGGSSTNLMMYSRAQRSDFDSWQMPGWSAEEMLPYLRKLETYHGPGAKDTHGSNGPIHVSGGTYRALKSENDFISAAKKVGWTEIEDLQDLDSNNGVQRAMRYISPDGKRQDAATKYLLPRLQNGKHPNLHVLIESKVVRVLFDNGNKKAVGVEYLPKTDSPENDESNKSGPPVQRVKARKLVIVSCGACGTPSVLERSGIGSPEILQRAGIPLVAEVPGVGYEYEDHQLLTYPYKSSLDVEETIDAVVSGRRSVEELVRNNDKILGWNTMDIACKLRPSETDIARLGPEFEKTWNRDFKKNPNKPLVLMSLINGFPGDPSTVPAGQYLGISVFTVYPYSRGHLHITGPSPSDPLDFSTGFFSDPGDIDLKKHMWAYKKQREIARRMHTYRGEVVSGHPPFPSSSKAACFERVNDYDHATIQGDIEYTADDDDILAQWLRENVGTTWHSVGTCKIAPLANNGVVDGKLRVYGVEALRIADLSILPRNVAANTNNTALAVGERAADIFIEELGLNRR
ncbi:glucose dehydrogenase, putative [Talaromyces stipitatus ATCC 10500]|uniref:Glucose dehydrogenase, putative n=1 Tax=Talaromyces stipitatus (strain ATCC 10500 / CBS 375.48 / QM 6759 / NRRL 1006) TaxID=441959 RepID=B8MSB1_TALSN|nr:glucose dehydrogenase, putative [Talaromyces stipitatus ATCC 10500]EED11964.1 glucose dehydrogenase, putative [Talaromyces stipitatus ATCC 10500]